MSVTLLPAYSKLADNEDVPPVLRDRVPDGWRLRDHQAATFRLLSMRDADVVINIAMTGDGKSLAAQLPTLIAGRPLLAMYPTNELIGDQLRQVDQARNRWGGQDLRVARLDARRLDELEAEADLERRADALLNICRNHQIVLTNPDIFHYVMEQYYLRTGKHGDAPDRVVGPLLQLFDHFVFDEFHVFQAPQVIAVVNALLFIHEVTGPARPHKFVFLSATPEPLLLRYLERADLTYRLIENQYTHGPRNPDPQRWQRILQGCILHFAPLSAEEWVEAHLEDTLLPFFLERRPAAKGAIIVNSVASAQRLVERLRPAFAANGLTVAPNTGFDAPERRRASYQADLLVGTSTVDVGIDFQINLLIFESRDAGTFLQRLGRLGRHDGYERDGILHRFPDFQAHALVPRWLYERLFMMDAGVTPALAEGMELNREAFASIIPEAFPQSATFHQYGRLWGGLQAARIIRGLYHPAIGRTYAGTRERLAQRYGRTLGVSIGRELARIRELEQEERPLLEEAWSFRGGGDLVSGVIDQCEAGPARIKVYDLFGLLTNFDLTLIDEREFYDEVTGWGLPRRGYERRDLVGWWRVRGVRAERNDVRVIFNQDLGGWREDEFGVTQVVEHVELDAPGVEGLVTLNRRIARRKMVALLCLLHPTELARRLRLPQPFLVHRLVSRDGDEGSISFGRQALLLETALRSRPDVRCGGRPMIV